MDQVKEIKMFLKDVLNDKPVDCRIMAQRIHEIHKDILNIIMNSKNEYLWQFPPSLREDTEVLSKITSHLYYMNNLIKEDAFKYLKEVNDLEKFLNKIQSCNFLYKKVG